MIFKKKIKKKLCFLGAGDCLFAGKRQKGCYFSEVSTDFYLFIFLIMEISGVQENGPGLMFYKTIIKAAAARSC